MPPKPKNDLIKDTLTLDPTLTPQQVADMHDVAVATVKRVAKELSGKHLVDDKTYKFIDADGIVHDLQVVAKKTKVIYLGVVPKPEPAPAPVSKTFNINGTTYTVTPSILEGLPPDEPNATYPAFTNGMLMTLANLH